MTYWKPEATENARLAQGISKRDTHGPRGTYGGIKLMSVLDPLPGVVGLASVISITVQPSPLSPHSPFHHGIQKSYLYGKVNQETLPVCKNL